MRLASSYARSRDGVRFDYVATVIFEPQSAAWSAVIERGGVLVAIESGTCSRDTLNVIEEIAAVRANIEWVIRERIP